MVGQKNDFVHLNTRTIRGIEERLVGYGMFTEILKDLRKQKKVTQVQLAEAIGVSAGNVGDWENGKSRPNYEALISLANFFGVSADVLLGLKEVDERTTVLADWEVDLVSMIRKMDARDQEDIFGLASMKYARNIKKEA